MPPERLLWNVRCTDITDVDNERPIRWLVRSLALLSRRPDAIVVNSQRGQSDHERLGYRPKRWVNIPNGVDLTRFQPSANDRPQFRTRLGLRPDAITIGLVGRYHPMKDVKTFLEAGSSLLRCRPDTQFVLCGDCFTHENVDLGEMLTKLQLVRHVTLLGRRADVENVYPALDLLALCSIYGEGFPNVLCEAMACGVPCVATDVGDSADIIGDCGLIVPMRNPEALARACQTLLEGELQELGARARARMVTRYGLERMRAQYESLYRSLTINYC